VAASLDAERRRGRTRGPLHGIPVLLKDNLDTSDMPTTGGCLALAGHVPRQDAFQVRKLRDAGAVILGKVNLHELALGLTTISSYGGQTLNPYDLTRAPGGSSGGSGVAAAANFAAFAIGTGHRADPSASRRRTTPSSACARPRGCRAAAA
jgi:Asp-tRNA(Asn)/Glu-tRNA(Gln) amidotransferase A subunit family amidase